MLSISSPELKSVETWFEPPLGHQLSWLKYSFIEATAKTPSTASAFHFFPVQCRKPSYHPLTKAVNDIIKKLEDILMGL
jgi:hypothetical protein